MYNTKDTWDIQYNHCQCISENLWTHTYKGLFAMTQNIGVYCTKNELSQVILKLMNIDIWNYVLNIYK